MPARSKGDNGDGLGIPCGRTKMQLSDKPSFGILKEEEDEEDPRISWRRTVEMEAEKEG